MIAKNDISQLTKVSEGVRQELAAELRAADVNWKQAYGEYQSGGWYVAPLANSQGSEDQLKLDAGAPCATPLLGRMPSVQRFSRMPLPARRIETSVIFFPSIIGDCISVTGGLIEVGGLTGSFNRVNYLLSPGISCVIIDVITKGRMTKLKIRSVGNSFGVILPAELLEKLRCGEGDELFVTDSPNGVELSPYNPELEKQLDIAEEIMRENRDVLRRLAK